ncbi:hypothetical protein WUBG_09545 [Wuchereria bancrofti]|uniref:Uncharacterized protein n=1 Tax=Wuchereria bancrofti TaxID=6293 RepID=J9EAZ6_WUCBA|nr:hypothetical protein WUBG_09545 [Wuchereria bancrofti]
MGDKYEDLGPANALPPPPPQPQQILPTITPGQASQDRTELRSAQIGSSIIKKAAQRKDPKKTPADEDEEEGNFEIILLGIKYTTAQKTCMVISGIMGIFFLMAAIAAVVILLTGFKIFP